MQATAMKVALVAGPLALGVPIAVFAEAGPFAGFAGSWAGGGTVAMSDGSSEKFRCKANYAVDDGGRSVQQTLRCASDSYRFEISSAVTSERQYFWFLERIKPER